MIAMPRQNGGWLAKRGQLISERSAAARLGAGLKRPCRAISEMLEEVRSLEPDGACVAKLEGDLDELGKVNRAKSPINNLVLPHKATEDIRDLAAAMSAQSWKLTMMHCRQRHRTMPVWARCASESLTSIRQRRCALMRPCSMTTSSCLSSGAELRTWW